MADLLFEAGMEEVPARMIAAAEAELTERVVELLRRERLLGAEHEVHSYSTPRRLAVEVKGVLAHQPDAVREITGPAWAVAFKEGKPTPAANAFAKKAGATEEALRTAEFEEQFLRQTDLHSQVLDREGFKEKFLAETATRARFFKIVSPRGNILQRLFASAGARRPTC